MFPKRIPVSDRIYLNIIETPKFKTNFITVDFLTKLSSETAALNALLPSVLKRGTEKYTDMAKLNEAMELLYASQIVANVSKLGDIQCFGFSAYSLDNAYALDGTDILGGTLDLMEEIIFRPYRENGKFCQAYVESEKRNLSDMIRAQINNKTAYAVRRCKEEMCRGEIFAIPETGTIEAVEAITADSLTEHYKTAYENASVEIFFVGKCDTEALIYRFVNMFKGLKRKDAEPLKTQVKRKAAGEVRDVVEKQPVNQGKLSLGFRTDCVLSDSDYYAYSLFRELYGGSPTSKLFMNVREKLSLCYYCHAIPEAHKGIMIVTSGIEVAKRREAQNEILAQLDACVKGDITDEELDSAKKSLMNAYHEISDDAGTIKAWYLSRLLAGRADSPEEAAEAIGAVSKQQLSSAAGKLTLDTVYFLEGTLKSEESDGEENNE